MLRGLATVSFYADDLAAAKRWYTEVLGVEAYFAFPPDGPPAYVEFRIGDYEHELGFIDARYAPHPRAQPSGSIAYWHVDDLQAALDRLVSLGAKEHEPITQRGDGTKGFATASVIDPFGNILGIMYNPHYVSVVGGQR